MSAPFLAIDYIPQSGSQSLTVSFTYHGRPPLVVEQEVTSLIESQVSTLEGLVDIQSVSAYGSGHVSVTFAADANMAYKEMELYALLRQMRNRLPSGVPFPAVIRRANETKEKAPLLIYEMTYTGDDAAANQWMESFLLPRLGSLPDLESIVPSGHRQFAWQISFDPYRLSRLGLSPTLIAEQIRAQLGRKEIGLIEQNNLLLPSAYFHPFERSSDLEHVRLVGHTQLKDVATVRIIQDRIKNYRRINGRSAVFLSFYPHEGENRLQVAANVHQLISNLKSEMPSGYALSLNYDDTAYLKKELDKTWTRAFISMLVISLFIFIGSRNGRYLTVMLGSIVVSLLITTGMIWLLDLPIDLYTLAAITISAGVLVDNAIVITDHLRKYGNLTILPAQLAAALTTIAALLVIFTLPDSYRQDLSSFAIVISLALGVSFFVSWWFSPALGTLCGLSQQANNQKKSNVRLKRRIQWLLVYQKLITYLARYRRVVIFCCILAFGLPVFLLPGRWEGQSWYNKSVGSDAYKEHARPWVNKLLGGSLRIFYQDVYEKSAYRTPEQTRLFITARLPYGHTLEQMNDIMKRVERYLSGFTEIDKFLTQVYSPRYASIQIMFKPDQESGAFPYLLKSRLIQRSLDWGGVTWSVYGIGKGFSNATGESLPNFRLTLKGYHYDKLEVIAENLAERLMQHKRIQTVNTNARLSWDQESYFQYRFRPHPNRQIFAEYRTTIDRLNWQSQQTNPTTFVNYQDRLMPLYVTSKTAESFSQRSLQFGGDEAVPLRYFGELEWVKNTDAVMREDRQYIRAVAFDYYGSYRFGDKYLNEVLESFRPALPPGFSIEKNEWSWNKTEEKRKYQLILILMLLVWMIGAAFLESFRQAWLLVLAIPLSFIGIFLIFGWGSFSFDQGGYAAFLLTGGLSVNALLYILSDFNQLKKKFTYQKALIRAISGKFMPVVMTVLSTCVGLIPFLIHGDGEVFWFAFAIGTIGGLLFSLVVAFVIMPLFLIKIPHSIAAI